MVKMDLDKLDDDQQNQENVSLHEISSTTNPSVCCFASYLSEQLYMEWK